MSISTKFETFCNNLRISNENLEKISYRYHQITRRINLDYWNIQSDTNHSLYVGSFGRDTEIFASDIDMLVQLPYSTYEKFNKYSVNGQSALLQEVKTVIEKTYSYSNLKGDGQIISFPFDDGISFEILPAFINKDDQSFTFANSNNGGSWHITDPRAEIEAINNLNKKSNGNLKRLCKMVRAWKNTNSVDISGILIDILAYRFINNWEHKDKSYTYYDWMTRDFFKYLSEVNKEQYEWYAMGSNRKIRCFGKFQNKAKQAYDTSLEAIKYEESSYEYSANLKWREIYGTKFPQ